MKNRMLRTTIAGCSLLALLAVGHVASAKTGFELTLRPGYGSAGSSSPVVYKPAGLAYMSDTGDIYSGKASPYGGGFLGDAFVGYRMLPILSAGLSADYHTSSATAPNDGTSDLSRNGWGVGLYVRAYIPIPGKLDPWASVGVGYMQDKQTYKRSVTTSGATLPLDWTLTHYGVAVPLALGVDYKLTDFFALGPSFQYTVVAPAGGCLKLGASTSLGSVANSSCTDASNVQRITSAKSYGVWSLGLDLRLTL